MTSPPARMPRWLVLLALVLVAGNLRLALSSPPALVSDIRAATGWSDAAIGTVTTLTVLCMGLFALIVPRVAQRIGRRHTVALALILLTVSLAARLAAGVPGVLYLTAIGAGIGIALAAGLVPSVVREQVPDRVGMATGLWTAAMMTGAALGGAVTVPLAGLLGSWQAALAFWCVPAGIALAVWLAVERPGHEESIGETPPVKIRQLPWRNRTAWSLTAYLMLNSMVFYTTLAWLAPSYVDRGWTPESAGLLLGLYTGSQVIGALVLPALAERIRARRTLYAAVLLVALVSLAAIGWAPAWLTLLVVTAFGVSLGAGFAMGLALLSEYAGDGGGSARLTAMAFSVTYLTASIGPLTAGLLLDRFGSWPQIYTLLVIVCALQLATVPALRRGVRIG